MYRHLLAAFVLWHAFAMLASALPSPGKAVDRRYWDEPTVQAEFAVWAGMLHTDSASLQERVHRAAVALADTKGALSAPFKPWLTLTNTTQSWHMFVAPHRFPTRMQLQGRQGSGAWEMLFEEGNPEARWRASRFATERMRANIFAWGWPETKKRWTSACTTFAEELFAERADLDTVRCRFAKAESPTAQQVREDDEPAERFVLSQTRLRGAVAP